MLRRRIAGDDYSERRSLRYFRSAHGQRIARALEIDARRVAVEHNLVVLKRAAFDDAIVREGDQVEIVNFVGGG